MSVTDPDQSLEQWAKRTDFPQPIRWGEVEAAILAMPKPDFDPEPQVGVDAGRGAMAAARIVRPVMWLLIALLFGSPLIGLAFILIAANAEGVDTAQEWMVAAFIPFIAAVVIPVAMGFMWSEIRRRIPWTMVLTGGTGVVSLIAYLVLRTAPEIMDVGWTTWLILAAAGGGLLVFGLMVFASKPGMGLPRQSKKKMTREEKQYSAMRAKVLEILIKRRLVDEDEIDVPELVEARLGSWHLLDLPKR